MKIKIFFTFFMILILCSCTVQEQMNPLIFVERFKKNMDDEITIEDSFTTDNEFIFFFNLYNNEEYVCQILTDKNQNIKKLCLAGNITNKTENVEYIFKKAIETYAPNENADEIIKELTVNQWNYMYSQWYRYVYIKSENGIFISIENIKLSTQSDAELTLNQSDIIYPQ